jgi:hypothetical protein
MVLGYNGSKDCLDDAGVPERGHTSFFFFFNNFFFFLFIYLFIFIL